MKYFLFLTVFLIQSALFGQFTDDFSDGDFTTNPVWSGDVGLFSATSNVLNSQSPGAATYYLSTASTLSTNAQWEFFIDLQFGTSGANIVDVYLMSDAANLNTTSNGYFVRFGLTSDEISLYKMVGGIETILIDGVDGLINSTSSNPFAIKVSRTSTDLWNLEYDDGAVGSFISAGTVTDASIGTSSFFGMLIEQSSAASPINGHFFDNIEVGNIPMDNTPPTLLSAAAINANLIDVLFDEAVDPATAQDFLNYDIQPFLSASSAVIDGTNPALIHITPISPLTNGTPYVLYTNLIEDLSGNASGSQSANFIYLIAESPLPGDIAINEFLCDPTPAIGLKEVEFVELYNKSSKIFNLQGWKLGDNSTDGTILDGWLLPGEYIVLTTTAGVDSFAVATGVTSFPGLNNSGDNIVVRDDNGVTLDSITYSDDWYGDPAKDGGGYTIERINPFDPCTDFSDWRASNDASGGTPGAVNSIFDATPDTQAPSIFQLIAYSPNVVQIDFNEGMDSTSLANANILTAPSLTISNRYITGTAPTSMTIQFVENIAESQDYSIQIQDVSDCWLNTTTLFGVFALPGLPAEGDVIINEIMCNPLSGGSDWIELYNNSEKLIDLYQWELAGYSNDTISGNKTINDHFLLQPGEYVVVAEDTLHILQNYPEYVPGRFVETDIPSYSNEEGTVYLIYLNQILDQVHYFDDWHFTLLDDDDGKSLERMDPDGVSNDKNNWHTAAESIGFATPGKENSQFYPAITNGEFSFTSETISPDNDGFEDVLQVNYEMSEPGLVATFTIYDDRGRLIAEVLESELISLRGTFTWDGVRKDNTKASIGMYIAVFEAFNIDGSVVFAKKKTFVVAGRL